MADNLLATKLYVPSIRPNLVSRPRLYDLLDKGLSRKLTLVSAPTGFGKSTLVTDWLSTRDHSVAWISLDQGDNDPVRFWLYLIAAIQTIHEEIGEEAHQIASMPQLRYTEPVAISLINEISHLANDLIVVLDDYHIIEAEQVHADLSYLLEHQPPNLHIILITRIDPVISLARLRAHSQLIEIRAEDLQFSSEEAANLFNEKMDLNLNHEQIDALNRHTESWAVGLQLAALSLKGQPEYDTFIEKFTGGHQFILDYLTEEVLVTLPNAMREFLLRTSILDRFCGALCKAVTSDPSSLQMLDEIRKKNLFLIPLDSSGSWFRYQHLFAEVLYTLLERDHPEEIGELHLKAAAWFDDEGYPDEAVDQALRSGDMARGRELVLKHWVPVLHRGEIATLLGWLDALPESSDGDDPYVALARCWALFISGKTSAVGPPLEQATSAYERKARESTLSRAEMDSIAAQLAMMRSVLARSRGEHAISVAHAEEATHLIPQEVFEGIGTSWNMLAAARSGAGDFDGAIEAYERGIGLSHKAGNLVGAYGCIYGQAMYLLVQGKLNKAEELCRLAIDRAVREGHGEFPAAASLYVAMARIELERYRLDEAERFLNQGLRIARPGGFMESVRAGRFIRARLAAASGDLDAAAKTIEDTGRILTVMDDPYLTGELSWQWTLHYLKSGDLGAARENLILLDEAITATKHANLLLWRDWLGPRLLSAEERYDEALKALDESIGSARAAKSNGELIHLLALRAVVLDALGDRNAACADLEDALGLGVSEGYILRWLDAGPGIETLLQDLRTGDDTPQSLHPYLDSLLDACQLAFGESIQPSTGTHPDLLTPREVEIMRLICEGYSNPEIASELVVTLNTIKKHTSNIYSKLGVRSRTQAIGRANELNLL